MKLVIKANPGEVAARAPELRQLLDRLVTEDSCDCDLHKAVRDDEPRKLNLRCLQQAVDHQQPEVERLKQLMLRRIHEVIDGAADA